MADENPVVETGSFVLSIDLAIGHPSGDSAGERQAVVAILHQVAQKIGSGEKRIFIQNNAGDVIASWVWAPETINGVPIDPMRDAPAAEAAAYADEEADDEEDDARAASKKKHAKR